MTERDAIRIGEWTFEPSLNRLGDGERRRALEPLAASVLAYLARHPRRVVSADELIEHLWGRRFVGDSPVYRIIAELRRALDDDAREPRYIQTIRKRGYRLVADVTGLPQAGPVTAAEGVPAVDVPRRQPWRAIGAGVALLALAAAWLWWQDDGALPTQAPDAPVIAVLPFENLAPGEQDLLARGLTDAVASRLANVADLRVIAQNSTRQFADSDEPARQIGEMIGATWLVTGTAMLRDSEPGGTLLRVNAHLVDVATDRYAWSQTYERPLTDVVLLQAEIAERVAQQLDVNLAAPARGEPGGHSASGLAARNAYLRGRLAYERGWLEPDLREAAAAFGEAVTLDPEFALAWAAFGLSELQLYAQYWDRSAEQLERARAAIDRALELDPRLVDGHFALGSYFEQRALYDAAREHLELVRKRQPSHTEALTALARVSQHLGNFAAAGRYLDSAVRLDPLNHRLLYQQGLTHVVDGQYRLAETGLERAIVMRPELLEGYLYKAVLYMAWQGDESLAAAEIERAVARLGRQTVLEFLLQPGLTGSFRFGGTALREALLDFELAGSNADPAAYHLAMAEVLEIRGDGEAARSHYGTAADLVAATIDRHPDEPFFHAMLGSAAAGAGRRQEALAAGRRLLEMAPVEDSVWHNADYLWYMAEIYVQLGMYDEAAEQVAEALRYPTTLTRTWIAVEPFWDPLRDHPRFREIVADDAPRR